MSKIITGHLVDPDGGSVAIIKVSGDDNCFQGTADVRGMSPAVRRLFDRYEEIVNGQVFSLLDEIEAEIVAVDLAVAWDDGTRSKVVDLQIFPGTGKISFRPVARRVTAAV